MSVIYFHTPNGTAGVRNSERHRADAFAKHAWEFALRLPGVDTGSSPHPLRKMLTAKGKEYGQEASLSDLFYFHEPMFERQGKPLDMWVVSMNTGLILAAPAMKLLLRVHASCEVHSFIQGKNRAWFAALIQDGLAQRILSADAGWEDVTALALQSSFEPMVLSFSVCDSFPNRHAASKGGWTPPENDPEGESWYSLSPTEKWDSAWRGLLPHAPSLEWNPARMDTFRFQDGLDGFALYAEAVSLP